MTYGIGKTEERTLSFAILQKGETYYRKTKVFDCEFITIEVLQDVVKDCIETFIKDKISDPTGLFNQNNKELYSFVYALIVEECRKGKFE